jgi:replicative DNA helicase
MIEAPGNSQPDKMRTIMSKLKQVALTNNIAIVAMQQLNRQMDGSPREPKMYDIADGSAIEKISSPVLIMWREDDNHTTISIYKARRLNADKFMNKE